MENIKTYPQTEAEEIAGNMCLLSCYCYCCGIAPDSKTYFNIAYDAIKAGADVSGVAGECFIQDPQKFIFWLSGRRVSVTKKSINSLEEIKEASPVRFVAPGYIPHFVVVENGLIVYDGLKYSKSVNLGKPKDARIIKLL